MTRPFRSVLAVDSSPFGRSLAILPVLAAIRAAHPEANIVAAACSGACELINGSNLAANCIDLGVIRESTRTFFSAANAFFRLLKRTRHQEFDVAIDFNPRIETQIACRINASRTIAPVRAGGWPDMTRGRTRSATTVLAQLGVPETSFRVCVSERESARFEELLAKRGSRGGEPLVILYVGGTRANEDWSVPRFAELGGRLANNFAARIIAADVPYDRAFTSRIDSLLPSESIRLGAPRAVELLAAIARGTLVITDDTDVAKLASELGTPSIDLDTRSDASGEGLRRAPKRPSADEVYALACEIIQKSRTQSLFQR